MTKLLERAFAEAGKLSPDEQDVLASWVLAELTDEDEFDQAIATSADKLAILAKEALAEHRAGETRELDPDRLRIPIRRASFAAFSRRCHTVSSFKHGKRTGCFA